MTQAIATTAYRKLNAKKIEATEATALMRHVPTLEKMLWGGTVMLIVDHVISGEVTWRYPFFTALTEAGGADVMLREMLTVALPMSLVLTAVWVVYAFAKERKNQTIKQLNNQTIKQLNN